MTACINKAIAAVSWYPSGSRSSGPGWWGAPSPHRHGHLWSPRPPSETKTRLPQQAFLFFSRVAELASTETLSAPELHVVLGTISCVNHFRYVGWRSDAGRRQGDVSASWCNLGAQEPRKLFKRRHRRYIFSSHDSFDNVVCWAV